MSPGWLALVLVSPMFQADPPRIGIRAFKLERQLEVWGSKSDRGPYRLLATYPIAAMSGVLGPKLKEGDMQVPEGFYVVNRFNPKSKYHLSLGLNYPNASDRKRGEGRNLGKDIFIHGKRVSAGCLAMTDPVIEVIYRQAIHARDAGQDSIPVAIFPARLNATNWKALRKQYASNADIVHFWITLLPGYARFEKNHLWPNPEIDDDGDYIWPQTD